MIRVEGVLKNFGSIKAVDDISFNVGEGENVVLLGTSGCGKTTTLRMINRLIETSVGNIYIGGKNIKSLPPEELRRGIGYVLQHNGLFPHYTVAENISIVPDLLKWPKKKTAQRVEELLEQLHLPKQYLSLYPHELSGGQQQRVGLARALAADPPVLLMDEPFGALDAVTRRGITEEFAHLGVLKEKTILLVTHDIREAFSLGNHILLMDRGKIVQAGSSVELLFSPANEFVSRFFEGQRMELELNSVLARDIWPFIFSSGNKENITPKIDDEKSVWDVMEFLSVHEAKSVAIVNSSTGEIKYAGYDLLFEALKKLKDNR